MSKIYIAILEEDKKELDKLKKMIKSLWSNITFVSCVKYEDLEEAINIYKDQLKLVCIGNIGGQTDFESAKKLRKENMMIPLIMIGSEDLYREALDVYACGYLKRPIDKKQLEHTLKPAQFLTRGLRGKTLKLKYRAHMYSIELDQILYISSNLHTVNVYLENGEIMSSRSKLDDYEEQLKETSFVRCHQSYWVNMDKITSIRKKQITINEKDIPISRAYSDSAYNKYIEYMNDNGKTEKINAL